jgi:hypothetical protein
LVARRDVNFVWCAPRIGHIHETVCL